MAKSARAPHTPAARPVVAMKESGTATRERQLPPRVLLVDDDTGILDVLATLFEEDGYRVAPCSTLEEAIALAGEGDVQLVITDRRLAGGDGLDLIRHLRHHGPHSARIILLSASRPVAAEQEVPLLDEMGVVRMTKPFDIDQLGETARELTGWQGAR